MTDTIRANVTEMFSTLEPWACSNSVANYGDSAGERTWRNALKIAHNFERWLVTKPAVASELMRDWARSTGAWDDEEVQAWSPHECLALFVQNIASELRICLNVDYQDLEECVEQYESTNWDSAPEFPIGHYTNCQKLGVYVDYYTGV